MRFIGVMTIIAILGVIGSTIHTTTTDPVFVAQLSRFSELAGANAELLGWIAIFAISVAGMSIPPALDAKDLRTGDDTLGSIGQFTSTAFLWFATTVLIVSCIYLLGIGWFAIGKA